MSQKKSKENGKKVLHCLIGSELHDYLRMIAIEQQTSVRAIIEGYCQFLYHTKKGGKDVEKNLYLE